MLEQVNSLDGEKWELIAVDYRIHRSLIQYFLLNMINKLKLSFISDDDDDDELNIFQNYWI